MMMTLRTSPVGEARKRTHSTTFSARMSRPCGIAAMVFLQDVLRQHPEERRFGHGWRDGVHRDLFGRIAPGKILDWRVHHCLACRIMRRVEYIEIVGTVGREVDILPHVRTVLHQRYGPLAAMKGRREIDRHLPFELLCGYVREIRHKVGARVVHEDVDAVRRAEHISQGTDIQQIDWVMPLARAKIRPVRL